MKLLFTGGGTAGHIQPSVAVIRAVKKRDPKTVCAFLGRSGGAENAPMETLADIMYTAEIEAPAFGKAPFSGVFKLLRSIQAAKRIILEFAPDAIFGTGGYVSFPALIVGQYMKIPTYIHESNAVVGTVTKHLGARCRKVFLSFDTCVAQLPKRTHTSRTGTPVDDSFRGCSKQIAKASLGIPQSRRLILSFGGSGGAEVFNHLCLESGTALTDERADLIHFHATGRKYYDGIVEDFSSLNHPNTKIFPFLSPMQTYLSAADVVICRAGAMTLSEICAVGVPAIVIPSPNVKNDHQTANAKTLADDGACLMLRESELTPALLCEAAKRLLSHPSECQKQRVAQKRHDSSDAADKIAEELLFQRKSH